MFVLSPARFPLPILPFPFPPKAIGSAGLATECSEAEPNGIAESGTSGDDITVADGTATVPNGSREVMVVGRTGAIAVTAEAAGVVPGTSKKSWKRLAGFGCVVVMAMA